MRFQRVEVPYNYRGPEPYKFINRSRGWHAGNHDEAHFWYHTLVSDDHRFLRGPMRFQRSRHHFAVHQEVPSRFARRHTGHGHHFDNHHEHGVAGHASHNHGGSRHGGTHRRSCGGINAGTLLGAAGGGFAGSHIGSGSGRLAATAAGTFLGAALGTQLGC